MILYNDDQVPIQINVKILERRFKNKVKRGLDSTISVSYVSISDVNYFVM